MKRNISNSKKQNLIDAESFNLSDLEKNLVIGCYIKFTSKYSTKSKRNQAKIIKLLKKLGIFGNSHKLFTMEL